MTSTTIRGNDDLPLTLPALLRARTKTFGAKAFLVCDDQRITFAELEARSRQLAKALVACGAGKGTHVGILHPNGVEFLVSSFAAARIGAVALPFSTFSTADELRWLLRHSDTEILLSATQYRSRRFPEVLREAIPELQYSAKVLPRNAAVPALRHIYFSEGAGAGAHTAWDARSLIGTGAVIDDAFLQALEDAVYPSDRFVIVHTSGSTSEPKGVMHTHGSLIRHIDNVNQLRRFSPEEAMFSNSPFFWIGGFGSNVVATLAAGSRLICSNSQNTSEVLDLLERERPTYVNGFAQSVAHLAKDPTFPQRDLTSIRRGNLYPIMPRALQPDDVELRHNMLGMTETGSIVLASEDEGPIPETLRGSFGKLLPGFEARVVDAASGIDCPRGTLGELWLRGPFLMEGYYGVPRSEVFTADGWYRTGDLVHTDADGVHFFYKGRRNDMIKTAGANVSPREVEAALVDVTGGRTSYVMGLNDADRGQIVVAVVVAEADEALDIEAIREKLARKVSAYKVPRHFVRMSATEIPFMSSGKLDGRKLKRMLAENKS
jgi:acyl-CoA synthetase (AMP-forming)/AMP-acid ligase II